MDKLTKVLRPSYVNNFSCIGGICEDSCCIGWNIDVDKLTYRKYFRTNDASMKERFRKHLYKNEECDFEEVDYGRMKIPESKWCPFLNSDKLCDIYSNLGEDHLSNVCHSYPRIYNVLDGVYEISLYMSCPEAVRILFKSKKPIEFISESVKLDKHIVHSYVDTGDKQWKGSPIKGLKQLRSTSIKIVQNRSGSITARLLTLGRKLDNSVGNYPLKAPNSYTFQLSFFKELIDSLEVFSEIDSPLFISQTESLIDGFKLNSDMDFNKKSALYQDIMKEIVEPFIHSNQHMFEHYLVNSIFQGNFPFTVNQEQFHGYLMLVVRYTFIRFYLAGIAAANGKLTTDDVVNMVQVHTKVINHHETFIHQTLENIIDRDFDNMEFVKAILE